MSTYLDTLPNDVQIIINDLVTSLNNYDAVVNVLEKNLVWEQFGPFSSRHYLTLSKRVKLTMWAHTDYLQLGMLHFGNPSFNHSSWVLYSKYTNERVSKEIPHSFEVQIEENRMKVLCTKPKRIS